MNAGRHIIMDAWGVTFEKLDDVEFVEKVLVESVIIGDGTLIDKCVHHFSPQGVTATATIAESHIAIHTWPEKGYFAADFFFCGEGKPDLAMEHFRKMFEPTNVNLREIQRGFDPEVKVHATSENQIGLS